ncbi:MAG: selenide, water dikinase SelD [Eubacteriales bacterium]|nr:selenide, water dikinase SelD [Eubacteriales bacterium]
MSKSEERETLTVCGGCNAKIGIEKLQRVLASLPAVPLDQRDPNLLIGYEGSEDAAVYRLGNGQLLIQTLDFFPPPIEDPYLFGYISATNALSDIYAMGAKPITALSIVCYPESGSDEVLAEILRGGAKALLDNNTSLCGGHSIHDPRVKYGLSVNGLCPEGQLLRNNSPKTGDHLVLTKRLGVGILTAAESVGALSTEHYETLIESMCTSNRRASELALAHAAHAMTDVTGFSLLGHLRELCSDKFGARIYSHRLPVLPGALEAAEELYLTAGAVRNRRALEAEVEFRHHQQSIEELCFDPQTSGGLLIALEAESAEALVADLEAAGEYAAIIGEVVAREADQKQIYVL